MHSTRFFGIGWCEVELYEKVLLQRKAFNRYIPGALGRPAGVHLPADAVSSHCAGHCALRSGACALVWLSKGGVSMSVRMVCIKAPRIVRAVVRLFGGSKG